MLELKVLILNKYILLEHHHNDTNGSKIRQQSSNVKTMLSSNRILTGNLSP